MKKLKEVMFNVAIILLSAYLFFVLTILTIQRYNYITAVNQIYGIAIENAILGIGAGIGIIAIINSIRNIKTAFKVMPLIMIEFVIFIFAIFLATLRTTDNFSLIVIISTSIFMLIYVVINIFTIQRKRKKM